MEVTESEMLVILLCTIHDILLEKLSQPTDVLQLLLVSFEAEAIIVYDRDASPCVSAVERLSAMFVD